MPHHATMFDCTDDAAERTQRAASAAIDRAILAERRADLPWRVLVFGAPPAPALPAA